MPLSKEILTGAESSLSVIKESLYHIVPALRNAKNPLDIPINSKQMKLIKDNFSQDAIETIKTEGLAKIDPSKSMKDILFHFFGMSENWKWGRNIAGMFMVHAPEYPTYTIPAFTQAKATGNATEMKKGEGLRGLLTGSLEGLAVGALVSGEKLKIKEMVPYIILGASLQYFSSKFFPWISEKAGKHFYNKRMASKSNQPEVKPAQPCPAKPVVFKQFVPTAVVTPAFKGFKTYKHIQANRLSI